MSDLNYLIIEGTIASKFYIQKETNKEVQAVNFTLKNTLKEGKYFKYAVVVWKSDIEKFLEKYKYGDKIRIAGHLQSTPYVDENNHTVYLAKVCADKISLLERGESTDV